MKSPGLGWIRRFIPFTPRSDEEIFGELVGLLTTEAMANRVVGNRNALIFYNAMIDTADQTGPHGDSEKAGRKAGKLTYGLVAALAAESGKKKMPKTPKAMVRFVKRELKGFDTPEAKERAVGVWLSRVKELLSGHDK